MSYIEIEWSIPNTESESPSKRAYKALEYARAAAKDFDSIFELFNREREDNVPHYEGEEVVISPVPIRCTGFCVEYELRAIRIVMDLVKGSFGTAAEQARNRLADRSLDGHYSIKYLQRGILESDHGPTATTDMIVETKILMNLAPHPNISKAHGVNGKGLDALLDSGRKSFFVISDRISELLSERIKEWEKGCGYKGHESKFIERLDIAMDIASALVYLHDRRLVYCIRPDKVGFDSRYGRIKLCDFSQARQDGMDEYARSITKSDDIRVLAYTAPEVLCQSAVSLLTDVYGFGILLWEVMSLQTPFACYNRATHLEHVVRNNERPSLDDSWSKDLCNLLVGCWDAHFRPSMKMVHETLEATLLFQDDEEAIIQAAMKLNNNIPDNGGSGDYDSKSRNRGKSIAGNVLRKASSLRDLEEPEGKVKAVRSEFKRTLSSNRVPDLPLNDIPQLLIDLGIRTGENDKDEEDTVETTPTAPSSVASMGSATSPREREAGNCVRSGSSESSFEGSSGKSTRPRRKLSRGASARDMRRRSRSTSRTPSKEPRSSMRRQSSKRIASPVKARKAIAADDDWSTPFQTDNNPAGSVAPSVSSPVKKKPIRRRSGNSVCEFHTSPIGSNTNMSGLHEPIANDKPVLIYQSPVKGPTAALTRRLSNRKTFNFANFDEACGDFQNGSATQLSTDGFQF